MNSNKKINEITIKVRISRTDDGLIGQQVKDALLELAHRMDLGSCSGEVINHEADHGERRITVDVSRKLFNDNF